MIRSIVSTLVVSAAFAFSIPALADIAPPDPCDGKKAGDACVMTDDTAGECTDKGGDLACVEVKDDSGSGSTSSSDSSGCSFGGAPSAPGVALFGVAAAAALAGVRRKSRRA